MSWLFRERYPDEVETELTQRDQFNNDDVELAEALVREALQNSLDAAEPADGSVRVRFDLVTEAENETAKFLSELFSPITHHLSAGGADLEEVDYGKCSYLVIEDFGTLGLTGTFNKRDNGNFSDFWRRHGRSHKMGGAGGRWGLGKLVFSSSSQLRSFLAYPVYTHTH